MAKLEHWPLWLQLLVLVPHVVLFSAALWLWWPKSRHGRYWLVGVLAYFWLFYFVFVR